MDWARKRRAAGARRAVLPVGFRLRDAVYAGIASIAIGALGGAVVYDRANDGELSSAAFDSIGQFLTGLPGQCLCRRGYGRRTGKPRRTGIVQEAGHDGEARCQ